MDRGFHAHRIAKGDVRKETLRRAEFDPQDAEVFERGDAGFAADQRALGFGAGR